MNSSHRPLFVLGRALASALLSLAAMPACSPSPAPTSSSNTPAPASSPAPALEADTPGFCGQPCPEQGHACPAETDSCCQAYVNVMGEVGEHHEFPVFNGEYALCVGALCTVDEGGKSATCRCQVYEGVSQVFETLDHPAPGDPNPEDILISYFSYVNDEIIESETGAPKVNQKCAGPAQWASCGGARCTKTGEHEALCACDVREATQEQSYCSTSCTEAPGEIRNGSDLPDRSGSITVCHQLGEWTEGVCNLQGTPAPA